MAEKPNPGVAAVLSFVFSGMGQIYNGQIKRGLWIIAIMSAGICFVVFGAVLVADFVLGKFAPVGELLLACASLLIGLAVTIVVGIWNIYDAYKGASG